MKAKDKKGKNVGSKEKRRRAETEGGTAGPTGGRGGGVEAVWRHLRA